MPIGEHIALVAACATIGGGTVAGCGGDDSGSSSTTSASPEATSTAAATGSAGSADAVEITDYKYDPETIQVQAGTEVTFTNHDDTAHTATADDGAFDTGDLDRGDSESVTLDTRGTFSYYCRFHPFMKATVEVQ